MDAKLGLALSVDAEIRSIGILLRTGGFFEIARFYDGYATRIQTATEGCGYVIRSEGRHMLF
jgi:hypothetical protein